MNHEWLRTQVLAGRKDADIAAELGIQAALVGYYRRKLGFKGKTRPRSLNVEKDWLIAQVAADRSDADIGKDFGVPASAVGFWRRKWNIAPRPRSQRAQQSYRARYPNGRMGELAANWRGGRMQTGSGYVRIYKPDHPNCNQSGYVYEHRLVMEEKLGRLLQLGEIVDHVDCNKSNNHPDNLRLHPSRSAHVKDHFNGRNEARNEVAELKAALAKYQEKYGPIDE